MVGAEDPSMRSTPLSPAAMLAVALSMFAPSACSPSTETDADADADVDVDADADADGDADADADADADGDADVDGDTDWDGICDEEAFPIALLTPDMLIVLDRSNSMQEAGHWDPVRAAIYSVTEALDDIVWFGLMVFPNVEEPDACVDRDNQCAAARAPLIDCAVTTSADIRTTLTDMPTCGGTPIASTLASARTYLTALAPTTGHPSYVVLATDGAPNCNPGLDGATCTCTAPVGGCVPNMLNCLDDARTNDVIDALRAAGIGVFVIGIAVSDWRAVLDEMASRGGTGAAIMADDPASIQAAFEAVTGAVSSCEFEIGEPDPSADPDLVNFYFDGDRVPFDADGLCDDGWLWVDEGHTRVRFCGPRCEALRDRDVAEVRATFGCPTLI
jgi:hypothetical protein